ncbi:MAG: nucleotidyltransferase domain-containing protein [Armatimonadota bacterium]|nr:nucleotidyltransferase domain-containing protein [Armatimonadota bacterium]
MDRDTVQREELIEEIRRFLRRVGVEDAIFFGSRARGDERPHSDLNLVLLSESFEGRPLGKLLPELQREWKLDLQLELLPCTPQHFEEMQEWNSLAREAAERGIRIHVDLECEEPQT